MEEDWILLMLESFNKRQGGNEKKGVWVWSKVWILMKLRLKDSENAKKLKSNQAFVVYRD